MSKYLLFVAFLVTIGLNNLFAQTTFNISNKTSGDTLLTIDNNGNMGIGLQVPEARLDLKLTDPWAWQRGIRALNPDMESGHRLMLVLGKSDDNKNMGHMNFWYNGDQDDLNRLSFGLYAVNDILNITGLGNVGIGTTDPQEKLEVAGTVYSTSGGFRFPDGSIQTKAITESGAGSIDELSDGKTGGLSVFLGAGAGLNDDGSTNRNTATGYDALHMNTTGFNNSADGYNALYSNTTGRDNVANGHSALFSNTSGAFNIGLGMSANRLNQTGSQNTIIGYEAGRGSDLHSKSGNVFLGYQAGYYETGDNKLYIENSDISTPLIWGDFSADSVRINGNLHVTGDMVIDGNTTNGNTLDQAYDQGGAGAGRTITADNGAVQIDGSDGLIVNGRVGIGTVAPASGLHLKGTGFPNSFLYIEGATDNDAGLRLYEGSTAKWHFFNNSALGGLQIYNTGGTRTVFFANQTTGNVGINTTTPGYPLSVNGIIHSISGGFRFPDGTIQTTAATGSDGNTLDQAYDQGGDGAGKTIIADAGAVTIDGTFGFLATGIVGSGGIPIEGGGTRMMWYPKKAAFRAGGVDGNPFGSSNWDDENIGNYSIAFGHKTIASNYASVAMGISAYASGLAATAIGQLSKAEGSYSFASGYNTMASGDYSNAMGMNTVAGGDYSVTMGREIETIGSYSVAIALNDQNGATLTQSNTMAIVGGKVAISTLYPEDAELHVAGENGVLFTGTIGSGTIPIEGGGTRMMWYPNKASFRVGHAGSTQWDDINIGSYSYALGVNTTASGFNSIALGRSTTASGDYSTAIGYQTSAYGNYATSLGFEAYAAGNYSTAMGARVSTSGDGSLIIGDYSSATTLSKPDNNRFYSRFANGYYFYTNSSATVGAFLGASANSWSSISDSTKKENFRPVDGEEFLNKINKFKLSSWNYIGQDPAQFRHYGPMAQDFYAAFGHDGVGTIGNDTTLASADFDGVNFIAIQALEKRTRELKKENDQLRSEMDRLRGEMAELKSALRDLARHPETGDVHAAGTKEMPGNDYRPENLNHR